MKVFLSYSHESLRQIALQVAALAGFWEIEVYVPPVISRADGNISGERILSKLDESDGVLLLDIPPYYQRASFSFEEEEAKNRKLPMAACNQNLSVMVRKGHGPINPALKALARLGRSLLKLAYVGRSVARDRADQAATAVSQNPPPK